MSGEGTEAILMSAPYPGVYKKLPVKDDRLVGACLDVSEASIRDCLAALQGARQCGTLCGSCMPELRRLVRATPAPAIA